MLRKAASAGFVLVLGAIVVLGASCKPDYPKCRNDKDCRDKEYCVNETCQQCRNDADCPTNQRCNQGRCEAKSSMSQRCADDLECPPGTSCINGSCRPCKADDECGEGGKCNQGRCARDSSGSQHNDNDGICRYEPIYFDFNENVLSTEATAAIDRDAECLKKKGNRSVTLTGHSDPRGTEEYNLALSDRRAQAVRDRLTRIGANPASVKLVPKGELEATGTDESGWAKDRRVDFSN